jgi:hypothetical protein
VIHEIRFDALLGMHTIDEAISIIPCSFIAGLSSLGFEKSTIMKVKNDHTFSVLEDLVH